MFEILHLIHRKQWLECHWYVSSNSQKVNISFKLVYSWKLQGQLSVFINFKLAKLSQVFITLEHAVKPIYSCPVEVYFKGFSLTSCAPLMGSITIFALCDHLFGTDPRSDLKKIKYGVRLISCTTKEDLLKFWTIQRDWSRRLRL